MHLSRSLAALLFAVPALAACADADRDLAQARQEMEAAADEVSVLGVELDTVAREVRQEMDSGNIAFGDRDDASGGDSAGAQITPAGDLLIDGEPVAVDDEERALLLAYRANVRDIALAGAAVGLQGASLATKAMGEAFRGVLSGDTKDMEARIEAEAAKIEEAAKGICDLLPPLLETQQALAARIPELQPYATMDQSDVDECTVSNGDANVDIDVDAQPADEGRGDAAAEAEAAGSEG